MSKAISSFLQDYKSNYAASQRFPNHCYGTFADIKPIEYGSDKENLMWLLVLSDSSLPDKVDIAITPEAAEFCLNNFVKGESQVRVPISFGVRMKDNKMVGISAAHLKSHGMPVLFNDKKPAEVAK